MPESQAYMDLLAFERKLDATIMRKRLDIQEALKRPMKVEHSFFLFLFYEKQIEYFCYFQIKRKLRIFISNQSYPAKPDADSEDELVSQWELRIEGKLVDDVSDVIIYLN